MRPSRRFTKLLAPISFSETTDAVVNHVRRIAEVNEGEVVLLHVVPTQSYRLHRAIYRPEEAGGADVEHAEKVSRELLEELGRKSLGRVTWRALTVRASNPANAILDVQRELDSDLIVVSKSASSEIAARIQGGLHEKLIRSSPCAVWGASTRPEYAAQESVKNVLAPVGFDRPSVAVTHLAGSIAEAQRGRVRLLHAIPTEPSYLEVRRDTYGFDNVEPVSIGKAQKVAQQRLERFAAEHLGEIPHETAVAVGYDRATAILEEEKAWKPDVITMATAGFTGFFQLVLGSTAETVARKSLCSVVTLRMRS
ncbi:MAG TPA: universal stress protein [Candidatus Binatia bacterium]|nr:universal stress protein [Candidatus Binatia bacterium]